MNRLKAVLFLFLFAGILCGQNTGKFYKKISRNAEQNYHTEDLPQVEHFEITYSPDKEILEAVYVDGVEIAPFQMWEGVERKKMYAATKNIESKSPGYFPYFHGELYTKTQTGTLLTSHLIAPTSHGAAYMSNKPYEPVSGIYTYDYIVSPLLNPNKERIGDLPTAFTVQKKVLSSTTTDRTSKVSDTLYQDELCTKIESFYCINYFLTADDTLNLLNPLFPYTWNEKKTIEEIVKYWNGGKSCVHTITIVHKKNHAVLFYQHSAEAKDNTGRPFSEHYVTEFQKQGKKYVPKKFFFKGHNHIDNSRWFSQTGNQTIIFRTPSQNHKPMSQIRFFDAGSGYHYLEFCNLLEKPSTKILEFWEKYKDL